MRKFFKKEEVIYGLLVIVVFSIIYLPILINNNMYMYIDIGADTYCGSWPNIAYARALLSDMKLYDMGIGIGGSTVPIISAWILNPFHWSVFLFDEYYTSIGLYIGLLLRNIVLAYYSYRYVGIKNINGIARIVSSLIIVFSGWMIGWGQFYSFSAIYVFFIMALYGFEVWLKKKSFVMFIFSVCMLAVISPYFCYMTLLFLGGYYILYIACKDNWKKSNIKNTIIHGLKTLGLVLLTLGISAIIFIPSIDEMLKSPRVSGDMAPTLALGSVQEYFSMVFRMFSNNILGINNFIGVRNWYESPFMFTGILSVFGIFIFILNQSNWKKYAKYIILILFTGIFINFSSIAFNGFSTITYRWTFIFVPVFALATGNSFNRLSERKSKIVSLLITLLFDIVFCNFGLWLKKNYPDGGIMWSSLYLVFFFLNFYVLCICFLKNIKIQQSVLVAVLAVELALNGYYSVNRSGIISNEYKETCSYFDDSNIAVEYLNELDDSFYRISKKYSVIDLNDNLIQHYIGERRYSSPLPGILWDFISFFDLRVPGSNYFYGFDDKQALRNISAGKYRFTKSNEKYFGYEQIAECGNVKIHENMNSCTFGILYDNYVTENDISEFDSYERQDILYSTVILDKDIKENIPLLSMDEIRKALTDVELVDAAVNVSGDDWVMDIMSNSEPIIVRFTGENATGAITLYTDTGEEAGENKISFSGINGEKIYYIDTLNIHSLSIQKQAGNIEDVMIEKVDGVKLKEKCTQRKEQAIYIDYFSDTLIRGSCENDVNKLLLLPILYDKNWKVEVNGKEKELYKADGGYMAVCLEAGKNDIEVSYISNSFYLGAIISFVSICILLYTIYCTRKNVQNNFIKDTSEA